MKKLAAYFFRTSAGNEPVKDWLKSLAREERRVIGGAIQAVEFGWPIGMPLCRHLENGIYEIRIGLEKRSARILFCMDGNIMYLLHGFIKKTQKTPRSDIELAKARKNLLESQND